MTAQDVIIAAGGGSASIAAFFLRECYLMLKKSISDIGKLREEQIRMESEWQSMKGEMQVVKEKLKIFHA